MTDGDWERLIGCYKAAKRACPDFEFTVEWCLDLAGMPQSRAAEVRRDGRLGLAGVR